MDLKLRNFCNIYVKNSKQYYHLVSDIWSVGSLTFRKLDMDDTYVS